MPNNYISSREPIVDGDTKVFSRNWFRFFDAISKKVQILVGSVSTSATAGAATALPVKPAGYITINVNGTNYKVPYYNE